MKLWILNHHAVPLDAPGGTRHAVLAKFLSEAGHDVTVFVSAVPHPQGKHVDVPPGKRFVDEMYDRVRFRFVPTRPVRGSVSRFRSMLDYRKNVLRGVEGLDRPDAIVGSCVHLHAVDAGRRLARRFGVPFLFEIRDVWPETLSDIGALSRIHPVYRYLRAIEKRQYREADRILVLLPGMDAYVRRHGAVPDQIVYLPNGVDPDLYPDPEPPDEEGPFTVSFFGAHGPANGLETVVRAARLLQDDPGGAPVRFRLVGEGAEKPRLRDLAESLGLKNLEFRDAVPKAQLASLARESHAFVFHLVDMPVLRKYGVSSNKLFDYLLAARPILYGCRSFNNPVEEAGAGASVPPGDSDALARAVRSIRDLPAPERAEMGRRGRAWVLEHHDLRRISGTFDETVRSLRPRSASSRAAKSILKRAGDVFASAIALALLSPLMLLAAFLVRCSLGAPVLFRQARPGLGGRPFTLLKFRTMKEAKNAADSRPARDAERLTRVGRILRRTSLDELPQLWNVLRGDMSLVGPRPLLMQYVGRYSDRQMRRHEARPGITGWAQTHGRNAVTWEERFEHDVWYVERWSLWLDVRILFRTVWKTLTGEGVSQEGRATMEEFMGSAPESKVGREAKA